MTATVPGTTSGPTPAPAPAPAPDAPPLAPMLPEIARPPHGARRVDVAHLLFGRKLRTDQEQHERLTNPIALAVFASDALSSVAYATEEMLRVMLPVAAAAAFSAVVPLSIGIVLLLVALVFSSREIYLLY